ncbi:MFS transporter [Marinobacter sp. BGYM27]|uniref:MFS transporter n=1 Tax=Marinobacter sp. BGYM27 TaxID=2975597 RepID=UPI0021A73323|nr:MFS transporter [Marinobacter sp. BGYM27]MDG5500197.1 MFS transporter [Marinobacter sp. BGYM27]
MAHTTPTASADRNKTPVITHTRWSAVVTLALATLIIASELTLSAFALPLISAELKMPSSATAWVLLSFTLPLIAIAIPAGRWADRADVRRVFLLSLFGFGLFSILVSLASSFAMLMTARVLQGLAASFYLAVYMPVVATTVKPAQRGQAIAIISSIMMLGSVALAPLGGLVAEHWGWRSVFLIKLPLIGLVLALGFHTLRSAAPAPRPALPAITRTMLLEGLLIGAAMTALLIGIEQLQEQPSFAAGLTILALGLLVAWARLGSARPVVCLLMQPRFGLPALALMLIAANIGLMAFSLPFFVAEVMQRSPEVLSYAMLGFVVASAVMSPIAGMFADRFGALNVAAIGALLTTAGLLTLATLTAEATTLDLVWRAAVAGIGMAIFNAPVMSAILESTPRDQTGTASGVASVTRMAGSTLGPALAAFAWSSSGGGVAGVRTGVIMLSTLAFMGFLALLIAQRRPVSPSIATTAPATETE